MTRAALFITVVLAAAIPHALYAQRANQGERQAPPAVQACVGCHGNQGQGNPEADSPRIAGQSAYYLLKQLDSYANGSRRDRVMEPIARGLPPELRASVAAHYASLNAPFDERARSQRPSERGRVLANDGDNALGVPACRNCHGPGGVGEPPNIPYIAGLDAGYHSAELTAWKTGTRTNDAGQQMFRVAAALSAEDISAVAQYYASLPPPKPAPLNLLQAPPSQKKPPGTTPVTQPKGQREKSVGDRTRRADERRHSEGAGGTEGAPTKAEALGGRVVPVHPKMCRRPGATQWPRLSDAAKAETSPVSANQPVQRRRSGARASDHRHRCSRLRGLPHHSRHPLSATASSGRRSAAWPGEASSPEQLPNRPDVLVAFLQDPPALVPRTGMPNVGLTLEQARHIAAYLYTLETSMCA